MAKRVAVILSGCGAGDGSEIREAIFTLLALDRGGAEITFAAPNRPAAFVVNALTKERTTPKPPRNVLIESARIARGQIRDLAQLDVNDLDALVIPGGQGAAIHLSNYGDKAEVCEVNADLVRLFKACLASHRPMGFICLSPILAARVLGPVAGVRLTLGPRGTLAAKHAAVMGADVRPCPVNDVVIDTKSRVITTPAYMYDDPTVNEVYQGIDKLVHTLLAMAVDRNPPPPPARGPGERRAPTRARDSA